MSLADFLIHATRVTFIVLALFSLVELARTPDRARLDVALFFVCLAYVLAVQEVITFLGLRPEWLVKSIQLAVLAHGYLLLRMLDNLQPLPRWLMPATLLGLVLAWAIWLAFVAPPPAPSLVTIIYLVAVDGYAGVRLVRGALTTRGVTRRRLQFTALGAGLLAGALLVAAVNAVLPALAPASAYLISLLAILAGLAFYVGFAAPRRVRHWWQLSELERFLNASLMAPADEPVEAALGRLCQAAVSAVGGQAAFVLRRGQPAANWQVLAATEPPLAAWWAEHWPESWSQPATPAGPARLPAGRSVAPTISNGPQPARSLLLVPLNSSSSQPPDWLAVSLVHRPLFPRDDQALLNLLCSHSGLLLEQKAMIGQLRGQNQALRLANQELEAFADSVSHDLRTPLRHIEGFAELLRDGQSDGPAQVYLERIFTATARMNHLIEVFLGFSRLGRSELAAAPVALDALVAQIKEEVEADHPGRRIQWRIAPLPVVLGDAILLRQALSNVIGNAAKFTRPRALANIEIGAQTGGAAPGQVVFFVRDNGVGFDPAYLPQLFSMFRRLHHSSEFEGDGIGLAVVRRIVQRHNGRVWAEAALDGGATFYLALPAAAGAATALPAGALPPTALPASQPAVTQGE